MGNATEMRSNLRGVHLVSPHAGHLGSCEAAHLCRVSHRDSLQAWARAQQADLTWRTDLYRMPLSARSPHGVFCVRYSRRFW